MKTFTEAAQAAIERGDVIVAGAVRIACDPVVTVWSGQGTLPIDGDDYLGLGQRALAQMAGASVGAVAASVTLSLSGIDPEVLELLDADELRSAPTTIHRLLFDSSGTVLLDHHVFSRGRIDLVAADEQIGGEAAIVLTVEGAARGLGRRGGRMRTDADQRLIDETDGGMSRVSFAGEKTLYWGGKRPVTAGVATAATTTGGSSLGVNYDTALV